MSESIGCVSTQQVKHMTMQARDNKHMVTQKEFEFVLNTARLGFWNLDLDTNLTFRLNQDKKT